MFEKTKRCTILPEVSNLFYYEGIYQYLNSVISNILRTSFKFVTEWLSLHIHNLMLTYCNTI